MLLEITEPIMFLIKQQLSILVNSNNNLPHHCIPWCTANADDELLDNIRTLKHQMSAFDVILRYHVTPEVCNVKRPGNVPRLIWYNTKRNTRCPPCYGVCPREVAVRKTFTISSLSLISFHLLTFLNSLFSLDYAFP